MTGAHRCTGQYLTQKEAVMFDAITWGALSASALVAVVQVAGALGAVFG